MLSLLNVFFPAWVVIQLAATPAAPAKPEPKAKAPVAAAKADPAAAIAAKVQRFYDRTKDFSADFIQQYTRVALSRTSESRGTVKVLKPGMMRWDYREPAEKHFIADGKQLIVYDPEEEQVTIDPKFQISEQSTSLSFLWGQAKLGDEFKVVLGDRATVGAPAGTEVLQLTPKKDASYAKLELVVDPATGQVIESIIHESTGNLNRFKFSNVKTNGGIKAVEFEFKPPPGVDVVPINR